MKVKELLAEIQRLQDDNPDVDIGEFTLEMFTDSIFAEEANEICIDDYDIGKLTIYS